MRGKGNLRGKVIVLTRAAEQSEALAAALRRRGAHVMSFPVVEFRSPRNPKALERAAAEAARYDWIAFTSQNAVRFFLEAGRRVGRPLGLNGRPGPQVAAVGRETRKALAGHGIRVALSPRRSSAAGLFAALRTRVGGKKILLPQSDRAPATLAARLRAAGAKVTRVVAYSTARPRAANGAWLRRIRRGEADAVAFASPSAVENFVGLIGRQALRRLRTRTGWVSIGPSTSAALRQVSLPATEAKEASARGFVRALVSYCARERRD